VSIQREFQFRRKDGAVIWTLAAGTSLVNDSGQYVGNLYMHTDITERKGVETEIAHLASFPELNPNSVLELDKAGNINYLNPAVKTLLPDLAAQGSRHPFLTGWADLVNKLENDKTHVITREINVGHGWYLQNVTYLPPAKSFRMYAMDITERKKAEEAIRLDEARLESLLRITQREGGNVQDWLDNALEEAINLTGSKLGYIYHYSEEHQEFILNTWSKGVMKECTITKPLTVYKLEKTGIWGEAVKQRRPIMLNDFEAPNPLKKGYPQGHAPLHRYLTIPVIIDGHIVAVVGVANKATDYNESDIRQLQLLMDAVWKYINKQEAEEALRETKDYLENLINYANAPIIVWNPEFKITRFNHAFERLTGLTAKEVLGTELDILFPPDSREASLNLIRKAVTGERWEVVEIPVLKTDGTVRTVLWNSATLFTPDNKTVVATIAQGQDITELKNAQGKLLSYERLATIGKVSGSIAHELRNPLAVIDSSIFYLEKILPSADERVKNHLNRMASAIHRCTSVIEALLKLTHPEELRVGKVDIKTLVNAVLAEYCPTTVQTIRDFPAGEVSVRGDEEQLSIACRNIVTNAVQAMNGSGTLTVIINTSDNMARISFRDTGPGIPPENINKIFEPLFTTKAKGIGLGLSIAKAIVETHQGTITVVSEPGKGATFTLRLPLSTSKGII
jgi:PAS domain S-box-containing protein